MTMIFNILWLLADAFMGEAAGSGAAKEAELPTTTTAPPPPGMPAQQAQYYPQPEPQPQMVYVPAPEPQVGAGPEFGPQNSAHPLRTRFDPLGIDALLASVSRPYCPCKGWLPQGPLCQCMQLHEPWRPAGACRCRCSTEGVKGGEPAAMHGTAAGSPEAARLGLGEDAPWHSAQCTW